jgi:O-Antigen ligase
LNLSSMREGVPYGPQRGPLQLSASLWSTAFAFLFAFCIEFDVLVGGGGEGAAATGGYGYRISDLLCVVAIAALSIKALAPRRLMALVIFGLGMLTMAGIRVLEPSFADDPRTVILAVHYVAYSFAALYVAILLGNGAARDAYCWGLVLGLVATVPIFVMQANGYDSALINLGLLPGYYQIYIVTFSDVLRYSGLWGHPNEAAHVAALAAPAGAYLFLFRRRILPAALVLGAFLVIFYYTQSRGGLLVGAGILALPLLFGRRGRIDILRLVIAAATLAIGVVLLSQLDFISSRFEDAGTASNFAERLNTILFGLETALAHPFGISISDFYSIMSAGTGGVDSPHNGFIFFAVLFGWLPLAVVVSAIIRNLSVRSEGDTLLMFISLGTVFSFMFEQLPGTYPFAFVICLIVAWAFVNTKIGSDLRPAGEPAQSSRSTAPVPASMAGRLHTSGIAGS